MLKFVKSAKSCKKSVKMCKKSVKSCKKVLKFENKVLKLFKIVINGKKVKKKGRKNVWLDKKIVLTMDAVFTPHGIPVCKHLFFSVLKSKTGSGRESVFFLRFFQ